MQQLEEGLILEEIGWNEHFSSLFETFLKEVGDSERDNRDTYRTRNYFVSRVSCDHGHIVRLISPPSERLGRPAGLLKRMIVEKGFSLAVGDWVVCEDDGADADRGNDRLGEVKIVAALDRRTALERKSVGEHFTGEEGRAQVLAANFDRVMIVSSLSLEFNLRRIERLLTMAHGSGGRPIVVLNKSDLCENVAEALGSVRLIAPGVDVIALSATEDFGVSELASMFAKGETVAMIGSSGVGKSTIVNRLCGVEKLKVAGVREKDGRGRHTTTRRELVVLPSGAILIDTPGLREIQIFDGCEGAEEAFADLVEIAKRCRFRNCTHSGEPGCALLSGVDSGTVDPKRLRSYRKLTGEILHARIVKKRRGAAREAGRHEKFEKIEKIEKNERWLI
jgi:ribosome biogenesis GTPase / thiamine phosphate phosphatase